MVSIADETVDAMPLVAEMTRDALAVLQTATNGARDDGARTLVPLVAEHVAERLGRTQPRRAASS